MNGDRIEDTGEQRSGGGRARWAGTAEDPRGRGLRVTGRPTGRWRSKGACALAAAGLALSGISSPGCASTRTQESAGQYLDGSVLTTKVKAAILDEPSLKSFQIGVETNKDVVQLSGFVDSERSVQRAGEVAQGVRGVARVKNDLLVK